MGCRAAYHCRPPCRKLDLCHSRAGGEALEAVSTAATEAAKQAATGAWLAEFESGDPPRVAAPGLPHGLFGAWQQVDGTEETGNGLATQASGAISDDYVHATGPKANFRRLQAKAAPDKQRMTVMASAAPNAVLQSSQDGSSQ